MTRIGGAGSYVSSSLTGIGGGSYMATLPAVPCGETIEYYFEVRTDDGQTHTSPSDPVLSPYGVDAAEAQTLYADDFEADTGWTVDDDGFLTDGTWERGVPVNCDRGDPPTDYDGSGQCYLTANDAANACNSDVDAGATMLISPVMDATDPASAIAYARWYSNNSGGDPNNDTMDVEVSDDGGATWLTLETVGPAGPEVGGGWFSKSFLIAEVPGLANTADFMIRFVVSDPGTGSVVEAALDAVALQTFGCPTGVFGDIDGDGSVGIGDLLALLAAWGPCPNPPAECPSDLNGDGTTGISDLLAVLANWG